MRGFPSFAIGSRQRLVGGCHLRLRAPMAKFFIQYTLLKVFECSEPTERATGRFCLFSLIGNGLGPVLKVLGSRHRVLSFICLMERLLKVGRQ